MDNDRLFGFFVGAWSLQAHGRTGDAKPNLVVAPSAGKIGSRLPSCPVADKIILCPVMAIARREGWYLDNEVRFREAGTLPGEPGRSTDLTAAAPPFRGHDTCEHGLNR